MNPESDETNDSQSPLMNLRQIKACGHLLLGTLQLRIEQSGSREDPRKESIVARVFVKKRLKELPESDDTESRDFVLRALYTMIDENYVAVFTKIGQVSGELAFLSTIHEKPEFKTVETQFVWTCDYLFKTGQLDEHWRKGFHVPDTPEFTMPDVDEMGEEQKADFEIESERELRRQLEGYLAIEDHE